MVVLLAAIGLAGGLSFYAAKLSETERVRAPQAGTPVNRLHTRVPADVCPSTRFSAQWETQLADAVDRASTALLAGINTRVANGRSMADVFVIPPANSGLPGLFRRDFYGALHFVTRDSIAQRPSCSPDVTSLLAARG